MTRAALVSSRRPAPSRSSLRTQGAHWLAAALMPLTLFGTGCEQIRSWISDHIDWNSRPRITPALSSKFATIYQGNPPPKATRDSDCKPYLSIFEKSKDPQVQARLRTLQERHGSDCKVWMYEFTDMDGDGDSDWYWNTEKKQFMAYDDDIDGDGVSNIEDADPFDPRVGRTDSNHNGIPDHLDWSIPQVAAAQNISPSLVSLQAELLSKTGIIAVNQTSRHDTPTLRAFIETMTIAYGSVLDEHHQTFPNVKYFGAEAGEPNSKVLAYFQKSSSRIVFMDLARRPDANAVFGTSVPIEVYSTAIHEMAHAFQALLQDESQGRDIVQSELLSRHWREDRYRGVPSQEWRDRIDAELDHRVNIARSTHRPEMLEPVYDARLKSVLSMGTDVARENRILSRYSMTSEKEYFAESAAAYVMKNVLEKRFAHVSPPARRLELQGNMERLLESRDGLRATNIDPEAEDFLERHLHVERDLRFDRVTPRPDGLRGTWIRVGSH